MGLWGMDAFTARESSAIIANWLIGMLVVVNPEWQHSFFNRTRIAMVPFSNLMMSPVD